MVSRIGHRQRQLIELLASRGGTVPLADVARAIAPVRHGLICLGHGYASVKRAEWAGMVRRVRAADHRGRWIISLTERGALVARGEG